MTFPNDPAADFMDVAVKKKKKKCVEIDLEGEGGVGAVAPPHLKTH